MPDPKWPYVLEQRSACFGFLQPLDEVLHLQLSHMLKLTQSLSYSKSKRPGPMRGRCSWVNLIHR